MFGKLRPDPAKKLQKKYEAKLAAARDEQRRGDVVASARLHAEAEALRAELDRLEAGQRS